MNNTILSKSTYTTFYVILSQLFGIILTMFVAKKFGANEKVDIIYYVINVASFIIALFTNIFKTTLIPFVYKEIKQNSITLYEIQNIFLSYFTLILFAISLLMFFLAQTKYFFIAFPFSINFNLIKQIFYYAIPFVFISVLQSLMSTYSNIHFKFGIAEIVNVFKIFIVLFFVIFLSNKLNESSIIIGNLLGVFISLILTIYYLIRNNLLKYKFDFRHFIIFRNMICESFKPLLTSFLISSQILITNYLLSIFGSTGSITLLAFSQRFSSIPTLLFSSGFLTVFLTYSSKLEAENKDAELKNTITKSLSFLTFLVLPSILYFSIVQEDFIKILTIYTSFNLTDCNLIYGGLLVLLVSAFFLQIYSIVFRIYIIKKEHNALFKFSLLYFLSHIFLTLFILKYINGSIIGASFSLLFSNFLLLLLSFIHIYIKYDVFNLNYIIKNLLKSFVGILVVYILSIWIKNSILELHMIYRLIVIFIATSFVYLFVQFFLNNDIFNYLSKKINNRLFCKNN